MFVHLQAGSAGCLKPGQFGAKINKLELLRDLQSNFYVTVVSEECYVEILPGNLWIFILIISYFS